MKEAIIKIIVMEREKEHPLKLRRTPDRCPAVAKACGMPSSTFRYRAELYRKTKNRGCKCVS